MQSTFLTLFVLAGLALAQPPPVPGFPKGSFQISSVANTSLLLAVEGNSKEAGARIVLADKSSPSRLWRYNDDDLYLTNVNSEKLLTSPPDETPKPLVQAEEDTSEYFRQAWFYGGQLLESLSGCITNDPAEGLSIRKCDGRMEQKWSLDAVDM